MFPFAASATKNRAAHRFWGGPAHKRSDAVCAGPPPDNLLPGLYRYAFNEYIFQSWIPGARQRHRLLCFPWAHGALLGACAAGGFLLSQRAGEIYHARWFPLPCSSYVCSPSLCDGPIPGRQGTRNGLLLFFFPRIRVISIFKEPRRKQVRV